ncbi:hypothetical protein QA601_18415, partial [Chitinispirillales bacterium ANBcel5]|uniref:hypothetical protein n=1 Tax=Cellulosispirillum alkaliphilum TaxID=3039283 RepID=UPI002A4ED2D1|nr:hypothetical protein [Chitinispirillales bacterium ANBcel5]
ELLDNVERLYFYIDGHGSEKVYISLYLPPKIIRSITNNVQYISNTIDEFITFDVEFSEIVLEPITDETVDFTSEVYNPPHVVKGDFAHYKIEVNRGNFDPELITWRSKRGNVKFINTNGDESDEGKGFEVIVKGENSGEDTLEILIVGYDGTPPEVHIYILEELKTVDVYTCIVKNDVGDFAFTTEEIDFAFETANQILKQIGVRLNRKTLVPDSDMNPHQDQFYEISYEESLETLIDMTRIGDGLEVYFINGHRIPGSGMNAIAFYDRGIVITKQGNLDYPNTYLFSGNVLAHEILHSMRVEPGRGQFVKDIYAQWIPDTTLLERDHLPLDWGTGYYRKGTKLKHIVESLLMHGHEPPGYAIPRGRVMGYSMNNLGQIDFGLVNCGGILKTDDDGKITVIERYFAHDE